MILFQKFKNKYIDFKFYHRTKLNILFHFLTPVLQIYTIYLMFSNFGFVSILYLALFFVIPFITDGIGHLFEKNFGLVLIATKLRGSTNSAGATFVENFLFKILLFIETFLFIKIIK